MPWTAKRDDRCPTSQPWGVVKNADGSLEGCHESQEMAQRHVAALYASEEASMTDETRAEWSGAYINDLPDSSFLYIEPGGEKDEEGKTVPRLNRHFPVKDADGTVDLPHLRNALARIPQSNLPTDVKDAATAKAQRMLENARSLEEDEGDPRDRPPRDNLVRSMETTEFRAADDDESRSGRLGTIFGRMGTFDLWAEVRSMVEGHFIERTAPGAFTKTFRENRARMQLIYDHGRDPHIGRKPLGPLETITENERAVDYTGGLIDTPYNRDLEPGLRAGLYGSSYRFDTVKDAWRRRPGRSEYNPMGLPERTIVEAKVIELGPTAFPVYDGTSAGVRSLTDDFYASIVGRNALSVQAEPRAHPQPERREPSYPSVSLGDFIAGLQEK